MLFSICYFIYFKISSCVQQKSSEVYSGPSRTSKMELFVKTVNDFGPVTIFAKSSILDVRLGFEYVLKAVSKSFAKFTPKVLGGLLSFLISVKVNTCSWKFCEIFRTTTLQNTCPANIYLFNKVNNRNTRKSCELCSKLTIKTPERRQWRAFIIKFEHILLGKGFPSASIVNFEQVNVSWVWYQLLLNVIPKL